MLFRSGRLWREALGDGWSGAVNLMDQFGVGRAGAQCAPLQPLSDTAAFAAPCQRSSHQVSGASRGEGGRAAAAVYRKAKDGGTLSGYLYLCESNRRHRGTARLDESRAIEGAARPMVLRGERIRAVPPKRGAKARLSGHLSSLLLTFGLCQKSVAPGGETPVP